MPLHLDRALVPLLIVGAMTATAWLLFSGTKPARPAGQLAPGRGFQLGLERYAATGADVPPALTAPQVTSDPAQILAREQELGILEQAAHAGAQQGQIFDAAAASDIRRIINADFARRQPADRAALLSEVPAAGLQVNQPYPQAEPLATLPALLIAALPPLPPPLEYRFVGFDLVIRDTATNLIVDILPGAVARQ